ncbi:MAG: uroporphyrinogen decarboxylase family protein [Candidatus Caldatribacterium sp.]|uniref:uroporphyrinogen decarboxylase family protein n=1 Tax=Candidatus Caldatribacterium sp. TaxID=2282143 RepID=UPI0029999A85|nr:uroporphyrinogen decarboxylase family protein [Candidatus Caldatribacterium sp.]MCX7730205.1 uroporphyrinogen decarboxylase family protein [Candidatus Caldatribacterium sp.]MDW8081579.1 uroporphyrinogen decarboxylase family protein [Candidatus Calescibacterium sp.]
MDEHRWKAFKEKVLGGKGQDPLVTLIVDSPWIPGWQGISHFDYYLSFDAWLAANLRVYETYPHIVFLPGFWVEYGMAVEPSGFGCKINWYSGSTPTINPVLRSIDEVDTLSPPDPERDGLMPFVLWWYRKAQDVLREQGLFVRMVAARGPLVTAAHVRGLTEFLLDLKVEPEKTKKLLTITTEAVITWLQAQIQVVPTCEGILVLDDVVGFLSRKDYETFAHPYLKAVFDAFPNMIRVYHNDANILPFADLLPETGLQVLNFSHTIGIRDLAERTQGRVCLMGNIPPLEVLAQGTPEDVRRAAIACLEEARRYDGLRLLLSAGGGVSPGTPGENVAVLEGIAASS